MPDTNTIPVERIMSSAEVRNETGVSRSTFERWRAEHEFPEPFLILNGVRLWDRIDVEAWLAETASWRRLHSRNPTNPRARAA